MQLSPPSRIVLHGRLRKKFGTEFRLSVPTAGHAVYALIVTQPGFREELAKGQYRVVKGPVRTGTLLEERTISFQLAGRDLHIVPAAKGRGRSGGAIAKVVIGVALVALSVATAGGAFGPTAGFLGLGTAVPVLGVSAGGVGLLGVGLIFSGIGSILTHTPKPPAPRTSFMLSGPLNTNAQGGPVPLNYGTLVRVGSTVASSGYDAVAITNFTAISTTSGASFIDNIKLNFPGVSGGATGSVTTCSVSNPGSGYTYATATFTASLGGSGATATCVINGGVVEEVTITNGGSGYGAAPAVVISGDGTGALAVATVTATS